MTHKYEYSHTDTHACTHRLVRTHTQIQYLCHKFLVIHLFHDMLPPSHQYEKDAMPPLMINICLNTPIKTDRVIDIPDNTQTSL